MSRATRSITASTALRAVPQDAIDLEREAQTALNGLSDGEFLEVTIPSRTSRRRGGGVKALLPVALVRRYLQAQEVPGRELLIFDSDEEVSSEVAARMLGVSRPYLNELLDVEAIPYRRVGNQRRIRVLDLESYRSRRTTAEDAMRTMAGVVNQTAHGWSG